MVTDEPTLALFARFRRNRRTDAALRRLAREIGAVATCPRQGCARLRRCCGPWDPSTHDASIALPFCLMLKVDMDLDDIQIMDFRLSVLAGQMEDACLAGTS